MPRFLIGSALVILLVRCTLLYGYQVEISRQVPTEAALLIQEGEYEAAEKVLAEKGKLDPEIQSWLWLKQGKENEALEILEGRLGTGTPSPEVLLENLTIAADASPALGEKLYEKYNSKYPTIMADPLVTLFAVRIKGRLGKLDEAMKLADSVIDSGYTGEQLKETLLGLSTDLQTNQRAAEGIDYLDKLFILVPEASLEPGYQLQWAHEANAAGKPAQALLMIDKIETNYPDYAEAHRAIIAFAKGIAYESLNQRDESMANFKAVRALAETEPFAKYLGRPADMKIAQFNEEIAFEKKMKEQAAALARKTQPALQDSRSITRVVFIVVNCLVVLFFVVVLIVRKRRGRLMG